MTNEEIISIVNANSNKCGRDIKHELVMQHDPADLEQLQAQFDETLWVLRRQCGYDCDEQCPYTGKPCQF